MKTLGKVLLGIGAAVGAAFAGKKIYDTVKEKKEEAAAEAFTADGTDENKTSEESSSDYIHQDKKDRKKAKRQARRDKFVEKATVILNWAFAHEMQVKGFIVLVEVTVAMIELASGWKRFKAGDRAEKNTEEILKRMKEMEKNQGKTGPIDPDVYQKIWEDGVFDAKSDMLDKIKEAIKDGKAVKFTYDGDTIFSFYAKEAVA